MGWEAFDVTAPPSLPQWADPAGEPAPEGDGAMRKVLAACVPYFAFLHALLVPLRTDTLTERDWQTAVGFLDSRPIPSDLDGAAWTHRWRTFVTLVWETVEKDTGRRLQALRAKRAQAARPKTKTSIDWGGLLK